MSKRETVESHVDYGQRRFWRNCLTVANAINVENDEDQDCLWLWWPGGESEPAFFTYQDIQWCLDNPSDSLMPREWMIGAVNYVCPPTRKNVRILDREPKLAHVSNA